MTASAAQTAEVGRRGAGPVRLTIRFRAASLAELVLRYHGDVVPGGMFIRTRQGSALAAGTALQLSFDLETGVRVLEGSARVTHARAGDQPGIGVRFYRLCTRGQRLYDWLLRRKRDAQLAVAAPGGAEAEEFSEASTRELVSRGSRPAGVARQRIRSTACYVDSLTVTPVVSVDELLRRGAPAVAALGRAPDERFAPTSAKPGQAELRLRAGQLTGQLPRRDHPGRPALGRRAVERAGPPPLPPRARRRTRPTVPALPGRRRRPPPLPRAAKQRSKPPGASSEAPRPFSCRVTGPLPGWTTGGAPSPRRVATPAARPLDASRSRRAAPTPPGDEAGAHPVIDDGAEALRAAARDIRTTARSPGARLLSMLVWISIGAMLLAGLWLLRSRARSRADLRVELPVAGPPARTARPIAPPWRGPVLQRRGN